MCGDYAQNVRKKRKTAKNSTSFSDTIKEIFFLWGSSMKINLASKTVLLSAAFVLASCATTSHSVNQKEPSVQELIKAGKNAEAMQMFASKSSLDAADEDGNTALHAAARYNDVKMAEFLIEKGASLDLKNKNNETPLLLAIKHKNTETAKILVDAGADIFARDAERKPALEIAMENPDVYNDIMITKKTGYAVDFDGKSIVHYFVINKNEAAVQLCIKKEIPLSVKDDDGKTPLAYAFDHAENAVSIRIAAALILANAEPVRGDFAYFEDAVRTHNMNLRSDDGQTPLHIAAISGHSGIVSYLVSNKAVLSVQDSAGSTPLHEAVRYGRADIVKTLLDGGADVNAKDRLGKTPILLIIPRPSQKQIYQILIEKKADVSAKDSFGDTPLHNATLNASDEEILEMLIKNGASCNERNKQGVTPLAIAVERADSKQIVFFAKQGADINARDNKGQTPLTRAFEHDGILKLLVNEHNVNMHDSFGNTPLHIALLNNANTSDIEYLLSVGADENARNQNGDSVLYAAIKNDNRDAVALLLARGADVFATNSENDSPLRLAFKSGGEKQQWLLAPAVINATDGNKNTPLHYAASWELGDAVSALIVKGASVNAANSSGETPLFSAIQTDNPKIVKELLDNGANVNAHDNLGNTPLHHAVSWNANKAADILFKHNAEIDAKNVSGKTPLAFAARTGKLQIAQMLVNAGAYVDSTDATGKPVITDAIERIKADIAEMLIKNGANVQIQDMYGSNPYHEAAKTRNITLINLVRNAGANPLSRDSYGNTPFSILIKDSDTLINAVLGEQLTLMDTDGNTPIHIAVETKAAPAVMQMLIDKGYPINQRNGKGLTPLLEAITMKQTALAAVLLQNDADPFIFDNAGENAATAALQRGNEAVLDTLLETTGNSQDFQGETILHYAAKTATPETIKKLLSRDMDKTIKNRDGETPYAVAVRWKRDADILALLK